MSEKKGVLLSIAVPVYNEAANLAGLNDALVKVASDVAGDSYEIIYCNDGSHDNSAEIIKGFCGDNKRTK